MSTFRLSAVDAPTLEAVADPPPPAAVPVPVLFGEAQAAIASGAWAEASALLREVIRLEPGFHQDGHSARQLLADARRAHALASGRKPATGRWLLLLGVAALVLVPLVAGVAVVTHGDSTTDTAVVEAIAPTADLPPPTEMPPPPTAVAPALATLAPAPATLVPAAVPVVVAVVPAPLPPATPTLIPGTPALADIPLFASRAIEPEQSATALEVVAAPTPAVQTAAIAVPAPASPVPTPQPSPTTSPTLVAEIAADEVPLAPPEPSIAPAPETCETYDNQDTPCALADGAVINGYIRVQGGRNYFWFGVPVPDMQVSIRLTDLPADYDLYLFSDQVADPTQPIARSITPASEPETIAAVLHDVGIYVIEVVDDPSVPNVSDVPYTLTFGLKPPLAAPTPEPTPLPIPTPTLPPTPSLVSVPAVIGQSPNSAARVLHDAGLVVDVSNTDAFSPSGEGTVAMQDPPPAARLLPGATVKLGIASGHVVVPNVRGKPESEAYASLRAAGFNIQTRRRSDDGIPSGNALGTNPGDGAILGAGSSLELIISQGHH